jgi:hypothetical protein
MVAQGDAAQAPAANVGRRHAHPPPWHYRREPPSPHERDLMGEPPTAPFVVAGSSCAFITADRWNDGAGVGYVTGIECGVVAPPCPLAADDPATRVTWPLPAR